MRGITGTLVLLITVGYLASTVELPRAWSDLSPTQAKMADGWRRTTAGWEWHDGWERPIAALTQQPAAWRIHPFTIAALQVLTSLFALLCADLRIDQVRQPRAS